MHITYGDEPTNYNTDVTSFNKYAVPIEYRFQNLRYNNLQGQNQHAVPELFERHRLMQAANTNM